LAQALPLGVGISGRQPAEQQRPGQAEDGNPMG
jgi:hypothetical protein